MFTKKCFRSKVLTKLHFTTFVGLTATMLQMLIKLKYFLFSFTVKHTLSEMNASENFPVLIEVSCKIAIRFQAIELLVATTNDFCKRFWLIDRVNIFMSSHFFIKVSATLKVPLNFSSTINVDCLASQIFTAFVT